MARFAFTGGLFPTLLNHVGPLQGAWGHWGALIRLHGVSACCQRPVSVYHVDCGCFCALLGTHCCCLSPCGWYGPPSAPHPPPPPALPLPSTHPTAHPPHRPPTPPPTHPTTHPSPSRPPTPYKLYP